MKAVFPSDFLKMSARLLALETRFTSTDPTSTYGRAPQKWQQTGLKKLFQSSGLEPFRIRISRCAQQEEETYMRVMAEFDAEDDEFDAGAIEISDDEVYGD